MRGVDLSKGHYLGIGYGYTPLIPCMVLDIHGITLHIMVSIPSLHPLTGRTHHHEDS